MPGCPASRDGRWGCLQSGGHSENPAQNQPRILHWQDPTPPGQQEEAKCSCCLAGDPGEFGHPGVLTAGKLLPPKPPNIPQAKAEQAPKPAPGLRLVAELRDHRMQEAFSGLTCPGTAAAPRTARGGDAQPG